MTRENGKRSHIDDDQGERKRPPLANLAIYLVITIIVSVFVSSVLSYVFVHMLVK